MQRIRTRVVNQTGLHARPAALFVNTAKKFRSRVRVRNLNEPGDWVDAKNILGVLGLGAECGHELELEARGSDEREALTQLRQALETGLGDKIA